METPRDIIRGDAFPCPASNCEQTKHNIQKFSVFCMDCFSLQKLMQAAQHGGTTALNTFP